MHSGLFANLFVIRLYAYFHESIIREYNHINVELEYFVHVNQISDVFRFKCIPPAVTTASFRKAL